jgi:DNA-binding MarR family transcriptional regulator
VSDCPRVKPSFHTSRLPVRCVQPFGALTFHTSVDHQPTDKSASPLISGATKPLDTAQLVLHIQLIVNQETKRVECECLGFRVRKLNRIVSAIYDSALASAGVKTSQFTVLVAIANRESVRPSELTRLLQLDESTLSRNVERMCSKGWLRLVPDADRRSHLIEITEKGQILIGKCLPAWQEAQDKVSKWLGAESIAALRSALRKPAGFSFGPILVYAGISGGNK